MGVCLLFVPPRSTRSFIVCLFVVFLGVLSRVIPLLIIVLIGSCFLIIKSTRTGLWGLFHAHDIIHTMLIVSSLILPVPLILFLLTPTRGILVFTLKGEN